MSAVEQLSLECLACAGLGYLPCPCDTTDDCTCPLWECPECDGEGEL